MGRFGEIAEMRRSRNASTQRDEKGVRRVNEISRRENGGEPDGGLGAVGNLNADERSAGDWRFDPQGVSRERERQIILERDNPRELDAFGGLQGVAGDGWSDRDLVHLDDDAEVLQSAFDDRGVAFDITGARLAGVAFEEG